MDKPPSYSGEEHHSQQQHQGYEQGYEQGYQQGYQHQGYEPNTDYPAEPPPYPTQPPPYAPQQQDGYPPQKQQYEGGYQNQGYPPQNLGYPPQNPGYPPQGQGYIQQPVGFSSQSTNNTIVVVQNQPQLPAGVNPVVNDRLLLSILVCILCCWPIGICAIVKSSEARNRYMAGDYAGAVASAQTARNLACAALVCGLMIYLFEIILIVA